jgi:hypothetical protein
MKNMGIIGLREVVRTTSGPVVQVCGSGREAWTMDAGLLFMPEVYYGIRPEKVTQKALRSWFLESIDLGIAVSISVGRRIKAYSVQIIEKYKVR